MKSIRWINNQYLLSIRRRTRLVAFIWARFKASRSLFYPGSMGQGLQDRNGFVSKDIRKPLTSNGTSNWAFENINTFWPRTEIWIERWLECLFVRETRPGVVPPLMGGGRPSVGKCEVFVENVGQNLDKNEDDTGSSSSLVVPASDPLNIKSACLNMEVPQSIRSSISTPPPNTETTLWRSFPQVLVLLQISLNLQ